MKTKKELREFYNKEAKKYYHSRKKHRNDGKIILEEIKKTKKKNISILEFGCGGGRFINFLNSNLKNKNIKYIGVDISEGLLELAKKDNKKNNFLCEDITDYIKKTKQESIDFIIGIASFQHIPSQKERLYLMKNFYKSLKYGGKIILINRSISKRFINKHKKTIIKSIFKKIYTLGTHKWRDLKIPRKNNKNIYYRFYHMFNKKELFLLSKSSGFKTKKTSYIDKHGQECKERKKSNNTLFIGEKEVFN